MMRLNQKGQLVLPIFVVLLLFGLFWIPFVVHSRNVYWKMRMDAAADLTALSSARERARLLNAIATAQMSLNTLLPSYDGIAITGANLKPEIDFANQTLVGLYRSFALAVGVMGKRVAKLNGSNLPPIPLATQQSDSLSPKLTEKSLYVTYVAPGVPPVEQIYSPGYFTRDWKPRTLKAQPVHESLWVVCRGSICSRGKAELWLDVNGEDPLNNGGFPSGNEVGLRNVGIQCFYPQFNARLLPKQ